MAAQVVLGAVALLPLSSSPFSHPHVSVTRFVVPAMFKQATSSDSLQDIYGFEHVALPLLPSGLALVVGESKPEIVSHDDEYDAWSEDDADMWLKIEKYVLRHETDDAGACGVGGEIWPAAAALCEYMRNNTEDICGANVLELGCGTGACGIYAAALGASSVTLTDGGPEELMALARSNVAANAYHLSSADIEVKRLNWADAVHKGLSADVDLVLASDVCYGHAASAGEDELSATTHAALARTLLSLLLRPSSPRVLIAHEHRSPRREAALDAVLPRWDSDDEHLEDFTAACREVGLRLEGVWSRRPHCTVRGHFRSWSHDLSIAEVVVVGES